MNDLAASLASRAGLVVCDLDGVVWLSRQPIPGSVEAIDRLRAGGYRVLFATNNSGPLLGEHEQALATIGIPAVGDVVTSAQAAASLVVSDELVAVFGGPGIHEAVRQRGARPIDIGEVDMSDAGEVTAVIVGLTRSLTYDSLSRASTLVRRGARFIASNSDATFPTPDGPIPGGGTLVAAVMTAAGVDPVIAGKPHPPMADLVRSLEPAMRPSQMVMIGDRPSTDGLFARSLGCRYAQVRSGVIRPGDALEMGDGVAAPDIDVADLAGVADVLLESLPFPAR
ncbi:MAG TPA: HAD-IIA family hydrolase [Ilumatobacteraceae bacterium]|nr:HAD-IIA family hydrolase [Ilumatobacteraceae bacterium]